MSSSHASAMPRSSEPIRIVIADDHGVVRDGLRALLMHERGFEVVGTAADGEQAVALAGELQPDILLLDLSMPGLDGIGVLTQLREQSWRDRVRVVMLTAEVPRAVETRALALGARGTMLKDTSAELLFKGLRAVMGGEYWVRREIVGDLIRAMEGSAVTGHLRIKEKFGLSQREWEILQLVVAGHSNKEIAVQYGVSPDTVKHQVSSIFDKVGVSSRVELARFAYDHGLL